MPDIIDIPSPSRRPRTLLIGVAVVAAIFLGGGRLLSFYVDALWFHSLGFTEIFRKTLVLEWGLFFLFFAATFGLLYGTFLLLRERGRGTGMVRAVLVNGQPLTIDVGRWLKPAVLAFSLFVAWVSGSGMSAEWPTFVRWIYAPHIGSALDPVLGRPLNFYLLTLPAWQLLAGWLTVMAALVLALAVGLHMLRDRGTSIPDFHQDFRFADTQPAQWRGVYGAIAFLLVAFSLRVWLSRFNLLMGEHTIFSGVTYTDAHVDLPGLMLVAIVLLLGAAVATYSAMKRSGVRWVLAAVLPGALLYVAVQITGAAVDTFIVKPNELVKEQPYIRNNIEATRTAYALDSIVVRPFAAGTTVADADAANNQPTLQNIRLWDAQALQDTLRQIQEIRTYYDFPGIDIDRYNLDGHLRQVMLATRELSTEKLPESSRNWINERLIYTHGYGVTMNPVNGFTPEGLPTLLLGNMPVQSTVPSLNVSRPQIYFGEMTNSDVYVKTRQQEFDYPQGQSNSLTSYTGTGGIVLGNWLRRTIIALERGDVAKLPFSDDVAPDSRLLMRRNIQERVLSIAPFLTLDPDPYITVGDDGRLRWILDGFTAADTYPNARHYAMGDTTVNYLRNSVKIAVDAYDGTVTFCVMDETDPILAAYRNVFPGTFQPAAAMPATMRAHLRYTDTLLKLQAHAYGLYHMTDPATFFNREDLWTPATEATMDSQGQRSMQEMQPNYVLMNLPGEKGMEFVNILPFTPSNRNNLIGWIAGRSDGANYGTAVAYNFPKTRLVDGPSQIEARIDQNAQISGQLTLWNQQGSHVHRGNLLVIPTGTALLYAESIYLQADRSPMPELRLVVLALQDRLAYGTTFEAALSSLFNGTESSITQVAAQPSASPANSGTTASAASLTAVVPGPTNRNAEIQQAAQDLAEYQRLTAQGKLGEAGAKLDALKGILNRLAAER
ncbi:hypothetical protein Terro_4232 [Terriglobus roseus DSM 18391]|uniref:UPF0182 protein Terro_4232 n=1 Tax=Terriglobus roseus (strain DSM 18391 / NRRL B-41598 / KBS 63) TaxID=926566 RepID=I3ZMG9_TERRK|nr:UPF0182 family protein [Terriglobus roseus]AFL90437.1 hypothetical protein Terro_4232 [Terriglobus roseus DSM 18391]